MLIAKALRHRKSLAKNVMKGYYFLYTNFLGKIKLKCSIEVAEGGGGEGKTRPISDQAQIKGMNLQEYRAMPSLRDVAHEGVLCTFSVIL